ncbi:HAD family hydrolase [Streptomyces sp. NPDC091272]|uniref:HAD family hydrolase n=1 Tax=Streptomyces sp. NPDC091272 TaxID=3365981 RepID=UPI0038255AB4
MTSETTDPGQAASAIGQTVGSITEATCVLFDFDGPVCGLFAGHRAHHIADRLIARLDGWGVQLPLTAADRQDPQAVLRAVDAAHPDSGIVRELEQALTEEELRATRSAAPSPYVDDLIREWSARGVRLAITTNNSPRAASRYLGGRGLTPCFGHHIYGRTERLDLLKPHPDCLDRALRALGADPARSLMIGDTPSDLYAAQRAGVAFLGYAKDARRVTRLRDAGARAVVDSLADVLTLVTAGGARP